jgi:hypothetical protein
MNREQERDGVDIRLEAPKHGENVDDGESVRVGEVGRQARRRKRLSGYGQCRVAILILRNIE